MERSLLGENSLGFSNLVSISVRKEVGIGVVSSDGASTESR